MVGSRKGGGILMRNVSHLLQAVLTLREQGTAFQRLHLKKKSPQGTGGWLVPLRAEQFSVPSVLFYSPCVHCIFPMMFWILLKRLLLPTLPVGSC